ncbi:hemerythrin domain-containing protein [Pseudactinotalea sp.]|uniref:hemerythrin domain-containing protein n=1 Tax=Pseudactinotalea sp. TaxID=1926260 RepID=UPI003B3A8781
MTEDDPSRPIAWAEQMQRAHDRLREALALADESLDAGTVPEGVDVLLYCWGFCTALTGHHRAEDETLFPAVLGDRADLSDVVARLMQDHSMIEHLLTSLRHAVETGADPHTLRQHLDGVGAVMESHFRYEERELLGPLVGLDLEAAPEQALGPLA